MSENVILTKKYGAQQIKPVDENEVRRYAGYSGKGIDEDGALTDVLRMVEKDLSGRLSYRVCYRRMPISWEEETPVMPFYCKSKNLASCIKGCYEIIVFAATIGIEADRYIAKSQKLSPLRALIAQAYSAERVEALCDKFCCEIRELLKEEMLCATARFSPGYGDLPLETQADIFRLLDCGRQIGVYLNESLLMSPSKSVTAIFGIKKSNGKTDTQ